MSHLGDVLVELGPVTQDYVVSPGLSSDMRWVRAGDLNALRDELIGLRATAREAVRWRRGYARADRYCDALALNTGASPELTAAGEALRRIRAVVDGTEVNA